MALEQGETVFRYIDLTDPDGLRDADHHIELSRLRGQALTCVLNPEVYDYYHDKDYAFVPYKLKVSLQRARRGEIILPGERKYFYILNAGEPLYFIQSRHLAPAREDINPGPKKKQRRSSVGF